MGWESVTTELVENSTQYNGPIRPIPAGRYTLKLLSVKNSPFKPGRLDFDFVVDEGEYRGRRIFPTLPEPPDATYWSAGAAAKLLRQLGVEMAPGASLIETLNTASVNGHSRVSFEVIIDKPYTNNKGETVEKNTVQWFSSEPAA